MANAVVRLGPVRIDPAGHAARDFASCPAAIRGPGGMSGRRGREPGRPLASTRRQKSRRSAAASCEIAAPKWWTNVAAEGGEEGGVSEALAKDARARRLRRPPVRRSRGWRSAKPLRHSAGGAPAGRVGGFGQPLQTSSPRLEMADRLRVGRARGRESPAGTSTRRPRSD